MPRITERDESTRSPRPLGPSNQPPPPGPIMAAGHFPAPRQLLRPSTTPASRTTCAEAIGCSLLLPSGVTLRTARGGHQPLGVPLGLWLLGTWVKAARWGCRDAGSEKWWEGDHRGPGSHHEGR
ncbi:hypothetical protein H1C71_018448 [Ictidomys tridecemlineatus]|nr:hypothetical protein H1C71_018448 [Ictidomys tridecemlineatus]